MGAMDQAESGDSVSIGGILTPSHPKLLFVYVRAYSRVLTIVVESSNFLLKNCLEDRCRILNFVNNLKLKSEMYII